MLTCGGAPLYVATLIYFARDADIGLSLPPLRTFHLVLVGWIAYWLAGASVTVTKAYGSSVAAFAIC
ncbi:MAG: hypothetical protein LBL73_03675 [Synergistaceae bacterium]|jgi:hypothetical protein|nr:hypothetical protein [Synergistaceae bacterium]